MAESSSLAGSNSPAPPTDAVRAAERSSGEGAGMGPQDRALTEQKT